MSELSTSSLAQRRPLVATSSVGSLRVSQPTTLAPIYVVFEVRLSILNGLLHVLTFLRELSNQLRSGR